MNEVLVSVVVPTFNRANYLGRSIDSALVSCRGVAHEIIVVDDLSTDHTAEVVSAYDPGVVKYLRCESKQGGGGARNVGIAAASGEFIAFLDSDTIWAPDKIQRQLKVLESTSCRVDGVYSLVRKVDPDGREIEVFPRKIHSENVFMNLLVDNFIDTPSAVVRSEVARDIGGFDPSLPRFQDWEFFLRASQKFELIGIDEVLLDSIELPDSISKNDAARVTALKRIFERHYSPGMVSHANYRRMIVKIVNAMNICGHSSAGRDFILSTSLSVVEKLLLSFSTLIPISAVKWLNDVRKGLRSRVR